MYLFWLAKNNESSIALEQGTLFSFALKGKMEKNEQHLKDELNDN